MHRADLTARVAQLRTARIPFVHARVVMADAPTSAIPGDEAIVLGDGTIEGFVGGSCAEGTVRQQSLFLLDSGDTLMLRITPIIEEGPLGHAGPSAGRTVVHNPCLSGGTLEVFLEAERPPLLISVIGDTPIARALHALGAAAGYELTTFEGIVRPDTSAVVVASHGRGEEKALTTALEAEVPYVGLVASPKRGSAVVDGLALSAELRARVHTPAGIDIGARRPEEVALSILAEIVAVHPRLASSALDDARVTADRSGIDPVCAMAVQVGDDALHVESNGVPVWFCGRGCLEAFMAEPAAYPLAAPAGRHQPRRG